MDMIIWNLIHFFIGLIKKALGGDDDDDKHKNDKRDFTPEGHGGGVPSSGHSHQAHAGDGSVVDVKPWAPGGRPPATPNGPHPGGTDNVDKFRGHDKESLFDRLAGWLGHIWDAVGGELPPRKTKTPYTDNDPPPEKGEDGSSSDVSINNPVYANADAGVVDPGNTTGARKMMKRGQVDSSSSQKMLASGARVSFAGLATAVGVMVPIPMTLAYIHFRYHGRVRTRDVVNRYFVPILGIQAFVFVDMVFESLNVLPGATIPTGAGGAIWSAQILLFGISSFVGSMFLWRASSVDKSRRWVLAKKECEGVRFADQIETAV